MDNRSFFTNFNNEIKKCNSLYDLTKLQNKGQKFIDSPLLSPKQKRSYLKKYRQSQKLIKARAKTLNKNGV
jgi:hypothetical protein